MVDGIEISDILPSEMIPGNGSEALVGEVVLLVCGEIHSGLGGVFGKRIPLRVVCLLVAHDDETPVGHVA